MRWTANKCRGIPTSIEESIDDAVGKTSEPHAGMSGSLHVLEDSPDGSQFYAKFDTVLLSESLIDEKRKRAHDEEHHDTLNEVEIANDDCGLTPTEDDSVAHRGPPKSRPASIEANLDSPRDDHETLSRSNQHLQRLPQHLHLIYHLPPLPPHRQHLQGLHPTIKYIGLHVRRKPTVISKTRPPFLPPKDRDADRKHLSDREKMMKRCRAAEEKRRKALQERRLARELRIEQSLHIWEKEILPDWRIVHRNLAMRKLW
ncbi:hypothetical protein V8E53_008881 [Lactarius tabidus]